MRISIAAVLALTAALTAGCARPGEEPATHDPVPASPTARALPPGDGAPHNAENNGWKARAELTDAEKAAAATAAGRIEPALEAVRARNDFGYVATRSALLGLGYTAEQVQVESMRDPAVSGAVYAVRVSPRACVTGDVRPSGVTAHVEGAAAEFGCLEPYTH